MQDEQKVICALVYRMAMILNDPHHPESSLLLRTGKERSIVINLFLVCLSVRRDVYRSKRPIFTRFCACYQWPWLTHRLTGDTLSTSGIVDDVKFAHNSSHVAGDAN